MEVRFSAPKVAGSKILAFADVTVADGITVRGFRVINGEHAVFVAVPARTYTVDGQPRFVNQVVFATTELRDRFLNEVLEGYKRWKESQPAGEGVPS